MLHYAAVMRNAAQDRSPEFLWRAAAQQFASLHNPPQHVDVVWAAFRIAMGRRPAAHCCIDYNGYRIWLLSLSPHLGCLLLTDATFSRTEAKTILYELVHRFESLHTPARIETASGDSGDFSFGDELVQRYSVTGAAQGSSMGANGQVGHG